MSEIVYAPVLPFADGMFHRYVDLDIGCPHGFSGCEIHMCQSDSDGVRDVICTLLRDGGPWTPPAGTKARICYKTPAGGSSWYEHTERGRIAWKLAGNVLTFAISQRLNNHIGVTAVHLELRCNDIVMRTPSISVVVQADLCAKEPRFYPDEHVGHVYFNIAGVPNSVEDPFEEWFPAYKESLEQLKTDLEAKMQNPPLEIEATVTVEEEELPEQEVVGSGTLVDPIHYDGNQYLTKNLYYLQNSVIYKCVLGTRVPARYKLKDLLGMYVEKVKIIPEAGAAGTRNDPIQFVETTTLERRKFYIEKGALYLAICTTSYHPKSLRSCSVALPVADLEDMLN